MRFTVFRVCAGICFNSALRKAATLALLCGIPVALAAGEVISNTSPALLAPALPAAIQNVAHSAAPIASAPVQVSQTPQSTQVRDGVITEARDAWRRNDRARLAALRNTALAGAHPLAPWVDYWDLYSHLTSATASEVEAFYARWPGSYVEDRLRNDWLLVLGRRRDLSTFSRDFPRFHMKDDREVTCYALLTQHLAGQDVHDAARAAWFAQRDADDGCNVLTSTLVRDKALTTADVWQKVRLSIEINRPRAAQTAAYLISPGVAQAVAKIMDSPARYLELGLGTELKVKSNSKRKARAPTQPHLQFPPFQPDQLRELSVLAVMRMATNDPQAAARELHQPWAQALPPELAAAAWAAVAKEAALSLQFAAFGYYQRAFAEQRNAADSAAWSDDILAWAVRAALRSTATPEERWMLVATAIDAMSADERKEPAWVYWRARSLQGRADLGSTGDGPRLAARQMLETIVSPLTFYGNLANEDLGGRLILPPAPAVLTPTERQVASAHPGLRRALQMIALGLRDEGVREWNYSLRGMTDRELIAAAQIACDREVWDRCINTSDRTRTEFDLAQRFPTPFHHEVVAASGEIGLDPAYVYGLIRQESRFIMDARSGVGASGLMQIMPATARWTAKKIGLEYTPGMIADRGVNLKLGTSYLKLVLDSFEGSAALATAAYNAGPSRSRHWREGAEVEAAAWAEGIPFAETRDYVKKVLSNATVYSALLKSVPAPALKLRLGSTIGPRDAIAPVALQTGKDLP
ncbi:MAG: transglycosylase SLT domain-containing protein [Burkholderiales bacterium]